MTLPVRSYPPGRRSDARRPVPASRSALTRSSVGRPPPTLTHRRTGSGPGRKRRRLLLFAARLTSERQGECRRLRSTDVGGGGGRRRTQAGTGTDRPPGSNDSLPQNCLDVTRALFTSRRAQRLFLSSSSMELIWGRDAAIFRAGPGRPGRVGSEGGVAGSPAAAWQRAAIFMTPAVLSPPSRPLDGDAGSRHRPPTSEHHQKRRRAGRPAPAARAALNTNTAWQCSWKSDLAEVIRAAAGAAEARTAAIPRSWDRVGGSLRTDWGGRLSARLGPEGSAAGRTAEWAGMRG